MLEVNGSFPPGDEIEVAVEPRFLRGNYDHMETLIYMKDEQYHSKNPPELLG